MLWREALDRVAHEELSGDPLDGVLGIRGGTERLVGNGGHQPRAHGGAAQQVDRDALRDRDREGASAPAGGVEAMGALPQPHEGLLNELLRRRHSFSVWSVSSLISRHVSLRMPGVEGSSPTSVQLGCDRWTFGG